MRASLCIYPLVETKYNAFVTIGDVSCGLVCGDGQKAYMFFTDKETESLELTVFLLSLSIVCLTPLYFCMIRQQYCTRKSFLSLPFAQQCPFFISSGYLLVGLTSISPFVFGADTIICNSQEHTLIHGYSQNFWCSLTALALFIGIRLVVFYVCALSVCMFMTIYFPKYKQKRRYYHIAVWTCIIIFCILAIVGNAVSGDPYLGICTSSLTSREQLMLLDIVPLSTFICIFAVCLALSMRKICHQNKVLKEMNTVDEQFQSLQNRLLIYNLLQTTTVIAAVANFYRFYINLGEWEDTATSIVECQVGKTQMNEPREYESCVLEFADSSKPGMATYFTFQLCALISVMSVIVFQCSRKLQKESVTKLKAISTMLGCSSCRKTDKNAEVLPSYGGARVIQKNHD